MGQTLTSKNQKHTPYAAGYQPPGITTFPGGVSPTLYAINAQGAMHPITCTSANDNVATSLPADLSLSGARLTFTYTTVMG